MVAGILNSIASAPLQVLNRLNSRLVQHAPLTVVAATVVALYALSQLSKTYQEGSFKPMLIRALLHIPAVRELYKEKIRREFAKMKESVEKSWAPFGKPFTEIPEHGIKASELIQLVQKYYEETVKPLQRQQISGTIYQKNLDQDPVLLNPNQFDLEDSDPMKQLEQVFTFAFQRTYLFNSLHTKEFALGSFLKYQVIRMLSEIHGGNPNEVMGLVTSGGSESLLCAVRSYRDYCREVKGHKPGETVIIAPDTIHASVLKAESMYGVKVVLIPTDPSGRVDESKIFDAVRQYGNRVGAIFCSAPCYKTGTIDPVEKLAAFADVMKIGLHVDCCLGAFVGEHVKKTNYLSLKGVTSLSADTHKGGRSPKGSSVDMMKEMPNGENLYYYTIFALPNWSGGIYGTPNTGGSEPCTHVLHAFLAMLFLGKRGYREKAEVLCKSAQELADTIRHTEGLILLGEPDLHVVAFQIDPKLGMKKGAIYQFAEEMEKRGFTFNAMLDESLHFCVTDRFAADGEANCRMKQAAKESLAAVKELNDAGRPFPHAKMYCSMSEALSPDLKKQTWGEYLGNWLFGSMAAHELVKRHYCTLSNPSAIWKRRQVG